MSLNIIISTQSPTRETTFPRNGGTAFALHQATQHPVIKMHRDAKARQGAEVEKLSSIQKGSVIYITGHGGVQAQDITGGYLSQSSQSSSEGVLTHWPLENYRDLILDNTKNLKEGDTLTIVLWACNSGEGGFNSSAAQLGKLFLEKGINTQIICSTVELSRFNGVYEGDEIPGSKLRFRTPVESARIFDCSPAGIFESKNLGAIYFTPEDIILNPHDRKKLNTPLAMELFASEAFIKRCHSPEEAKIYLKKNSLELILRPSSKSYPDHTVFSASYLSSNGIINHYRFAIDNNNQLFHCSDENPSQWKKIELKHAIALENIKHYIAMKDTHELLVAKSDAKMTNPTIPLKKEAAKVPVLTSNNNKNDQANIVPPPLAKEIKKTTMEKVTHHLLSFFHKQDTLTLDELITKPWSDLPKQLKIKIQDFNETTRNINADSTKITWGGLPKNARKELIVQAEEYDLHQHSSHLK